MQKDHLCFLGKYVFTEGDYGESITFRLYDPDGNAFNATGFTPYFRVLNDSGGDIITEISPAWTTQASGIGTISFTSTNHPPDGDHAAKIQLEKAGQVLSFPVWQNIGVRVSSRSSRSP